MSSNTAHNQVKRNARRRRIRAKIFGTQERPRLSVYRSNRQLLAQIIDDTAGHTLASVSSLTQKGATPRERAEAAAAELAKKAQKVGIKKVVFDRGGFAYMATIKAFADAARNAGLEF